ncbi:MAG: hypothetical protein V2I43_19785 [Parvularcula sp.]|jgi:iron complex transport system substrate-binding protein|nr:hypothetical protein [Parvularcula sp.]
MLAAAFFLAAKLQVVSLDYCADQYVLRYVDRADILALSAGSRGDYAYGRKEAAHLPQMPADAEALLVAGPTHVVRSYGGDAALLASLKERGVVVVNIGWPSDLGAVADTELRVATALVAEEKGRAVAQQLRQDASGPAAPSRKVLYLTPSGVTAGPGTLVDAVIRAAGHQNFETRPGWHDLDLERLTTERPELLLRAFFDSEQSFEGSFSTYRHPVARRLLKDIPSVDVPGAVLSCAAAPVLEAVRALEEASP